MLYGNYGAYYVGLAQDRGIGDRLKDHLGDHHSARWDRFSWFGFRTVNRGLDDFGYSQLATINKLAVGQASEVIRDMEALLIRAVGCPDNRAKTRFPKGDEWTQVTRYDNEIGLLDRARITDSPFRRR